MPGNRPIFSARVQEHWGIGNYDADTLDGTTTSVNIPGVAWVGLAIEPVGGACSFNIDGGKTITVASGQTFDWTFRSLFWNRTLNRVSGTFTYIIEYVRYFTDSDA